MSAEDLFAEAWKKSVLCGMTLDREFRFYEKRKWRFDFALRASQMWAIEIEGHGRHTSFSGFRADCEKYNCAAALGWKLLRVPASVVMKDAAGVVDEICQLICGVIPEESVMR